MTTLYMPRYYCLMQWNNPIYNYIFSFVGHKRPWSGWWEVRGENKSFHSREEPDGKCSWGYSPSAVSESANGILSPIDWNHDFESELRQIEPLTYSVLFKVRTVAKIGPIGMGSPWNVSNANEALFDQRKAVGLIAVVCPHYTTHVRWGILTLIILSRDTLQFPLGRNSVQEFEIHMYLFRWLKVSNQLCIMRFMLDCPLFIDCIIGVESKMILTLVFSIVQICTSVTVWHLWKQTSPRCSRARRDRTNSYVSHLNALAAYLTLEMYDIAALGPTGLFQCAVGRLS